MESKNEMRILTFSLLLVLISCSPRVDNKPKKIPIEVEMILNDTTAFTFNRNFELRDEILGIEKDWTVQNEIKYLDEINLDKLEMLLLNGFIDPNDSQNESPTTKTFYEFMNRFPKVLAHGYAVSPYRDDYRITIEGLHVNEADVTKEMKTQFFDLCKDADDYYDKDELYSWWD